MLTASTARRETAASICKQNRKQALDAKKAKAAERKQIAWEIRVQVPKFMTAIAKAIKDAIALGEHKAHYYVNWSVADAACEAVKSRLAKRGFRCEYDWHHGTSDMGDFNAPCVVDWSDTTFDISWDKSIHPEKGRD